MLEAVTTTARQTQERVLRILDLMQEAQGPVDGTGAEDLQQGAPDGGGLLADAGKTGIAEKSEDRPGVVLHQ